MANLSKEASQWMVASADESKFCHVTGALVGDREIYIAWNYKTKVGPVRYLRQFLASVGFLLSERVNWWRDNVLFCVTGLELQSLITWSYGPRPVNDKAPHIMTGVSVRATLLITRTKEWKENKEKEPQFLGFLQEHNWWPVGISLVPTF